MSVNQNANIPQNGLIFCFDAANPKCIGYGENIILSNDNMGNGTYWSQLNTSTTYGYAGPFGLNNACLSANTGTSPSVFSQTVSTSISGTGQYRVSVYAKKGTGTFFTLNCYYNGDTEINTSFTFSTQLISGDTTGATMTYVGDGWYRCSVSVPARVNAGTLFVWRIWPSGRGAADTLNNYFYGAQAERGNLVGKTSIINGTTATFLTTPKDLSINGVTGALTNGPFHTSDGFGSIFFDGVDDILTFGNITASLQSGFTMIQTVKLTTNAGGLFYFNAPPMYMNFYLGASSNLRWETRPGYDLRSTATLPMNTWVHIVGTFSGVSVDNGAGTGKIYINGVLDSTMAMLSNASITGAPGIGAYAGTCSGLIGYSSIYNRELSAGEVKQHFSALRGRYGL